MLQIKMIRLRVKEGTELMELIDNVNKTLKDDLTVSIQKDSKVSIAAACFSIYAFQELKRELKNVDELQFAE